MKIAILSKGGNNYSTRRLKEVAIARGHDVEIVNYAKCYVSIEKNNPVVRYKGRHLINFDAIYSAHRTKLHKYGTAMVRHFENQGTFTTANSLAIVRSRDKLRAYQILGKAGVGIPKTVFARETANFEDVVELAGGTPLIIRSLAARTVTESFWLRPPRRPRP